MIYHHKNTIFVKNFKLVIVKIMGTIIYYLKETPTWVFIVFGLFLISGIKVLKPHPKSIKKLLVVPVALMTLSWMAIEGQSPLLWFPAAALISGWGGWKWIAKIPFKSLVKRSSFLKALLRLFYS